MYHWEGDQEEFLVLSGEALLIVEDEERRLQPWDLFHCPPRLPTTYRRRGHRAVRRLAVGVRNGDDDWGAYTVDPSVAMQHGASVEEETTEPRSPTRASRARERGRVRRGLVP